jgi:hypothetical protein
LIALALGIIGTILFMQAEGMGATLDLHHPPTHSSGLDRSLLVLFGSSFFFLSALRNERTGFVLSLIFNVAVNAVHSWVHQWDPSQTILGVVLSGILIFLTWQRNSRFLNYNHT